MSYPLLSNDARPRAEYYLVQSSIGTLDTHLEPLNNILNIFLCLCIERAVGARENSHSELTTNLVRTRDTAGRQIAVLSG